jgi:hypothetical protein
VHGSDLAALVVTYRRFDNLRVIVNLCIAAGITRIYIGADGSKGQLDHEDVAQVKLEIERLVYEYPNWIFPLINSENVGAALNILRSCDWIFSSEKFAVVLEDDCIPSSDFFAFVRDGEKFLCNDGNVYLICGSQFAPSTITKELTSFSIYPMVWGWATTRDKWNTVSSTMIYLGKSKFSFFKFENNDKTFWRAGARRAFAGYTEGWDSALVNAIRKLNGKVLVPGSNLVSNIGGDERATHTFQGSKWLNAELGSYSESKLEISDNGTLDNWIRQSLYRISFRHQITTRITYLMDKLKINKRKRLKLSSRWIRS